MTTSESELQRSIDRLDQTLNHLSEQLVRKDVYRSDQMLVKETLDNLRDDIKDVKTGVDKIEERRSSEKRAYLTSLLMPALLLVFQLYLVSRVGG